MVIILCIIINNNNMMIIIIIIIMMIIIIIIIMIIIIIIKIIIIIIIINENILLASLLIKTICNSGSSGLVGEQHVVKLKNLIIILCVFSAYSWLVNCMTICCAFLRLERLAVLQILQTRNRGLKLKTKSCAIWYVIYGKTC